MSKIRKILLGLTLICSICAFTIALPTYADEEEDYSLEATSLEADADASVADETPATPSISILPTNEYISLAADTVIEKQLVIANDGNTAYRFRLYAQPYTINDEDDQYTFAFNTNNSYTSISGWVTFQTESGEFSANTEYSIAPGESKTITYHISTPATVPAGGQYAAVFAETINDEAATGNINGIYTVSRVALLLYGRSTEGILVDSAIKDYSVPSFLLSGPITASSRIKNSGNIDVTATYKINVRGIFGNDLYSNTWNYPILPDTERYVVMTWEDTPSFGIYSVQYSVSTEDQSEERTTIVLIFPVYMIIITILLLTIISIGVIMVLKKRKERKSRLIV